MITQPAVGVSGGYFATILGSAGDGGPSPTRTDPTEGQASGTGAPGAGATSGDSGDPGSPGDYKKGGLVPGRGAETVQAHAGEYVINQAAVKKYGKKLLDAINGGKAKVMTRDEYVKSRR